MTLRSYLSADDPLFINRPVGVRDEYWDAVTDAVDRLQRAIDVDDLRLCIGCSKELVECVAKIVVEMRGEVLSNNATFPTVVDRAHRALGRKPGDMPEGSPTLRDISQAMRTMAGKVGDLRNAFGTGHGRPSLPAADLEVALISVEAASGWSRWALRRLGVIIENSPTQLASDLVEGAIFTRGLLIRRLADAGLPALDDSDQRLLGLSVARRAQGDTFVVQEEGVERCAQSDDQKAWPMPYREGIVEGLVYDRGGRFDLSLWGIRQLAQLLLTSGPKDLLAPVLDGAMSADLGARISEDSYRSQCLALLDELQPAVPREIAASWKALRDRAEIPF